jgi:hypothetical protein
VGGGMDDLDLEEMDEEDKKNAEWYEYGCV